MSGPLILEDTVRMVRRFVVVSEHQAHTVALWIAHTHVLADAFDTTPYLAITSAVWRSGKSRLLEVIALLTRSPLPAANLSDAVLFRVIEARQPTLLLDEADAIFGSKAREREELRGLLNAGWRRGAKAYRMGGANARTLEEFGVFCAEAFAGIGSYLPGTLADRSILIQLDRRTRSEHVERFRSREVTPEAEGLRDRLADWLEPQVELLRDARPELPEELDDRACDYWEPLLAIADLAGADWPERARLAALELSGAEVREDEALSIRLLADVRQAFDDRQAEALKTADLIEELVTVEEAPWGDWRGKQLTAQALSKLLRPYRVRTLPIWVEGKTVRGYKREQFAEAWERYLPRDGVRSVRSVRSQEESRTDLTLLTPSDFKALGPDPAPQAEPNAPNAPNAVTPASGDGDGFWQARDGRWRSFTTEPPTFPGEVLATAAAPPAAGGGGD